MTKNSTQEVLIKPTRYSSLHFRRCQRYSSSDRSGCDLLLWLASFCAWPFPCLFRIRMKEGVAGLTIKRLANLFQRLKIDSECLPLLQPPERRVTDACLFSQPIEGSPAVFQQLIYSNLDHGCTPVILYLPYMINIVYMRYILYLTYMSG